MEKINKLLFLTDCHFMAKNPLNRNDDYLESLLEKFSWVKSYAKANGISIVLLGGDIFETPSPSDYVANRVVDCMSDDLITYYYILGNHDIIGANIESVHHCKMGLMGRYPWFKNLEVLEFENCYICGYNFSKSMECPKTIQPRKDFKLKDKKKPIICVVHSNITNEPSIVVKDVHKTIHWDAITADADVVLSGHYHPGLDQVQQNTMGTYFANPGAMARMFLDNNDPIRVPSFIEITLTEKGVEDVEKKKIACYKKGVFNTRKKVEGINSHEMRIKFINALKEMQDENVMSSNILDMISKLKRDKKIRKQYGRKVIEMCEQKIEEISDE